jgi:outer membrane protein insertion porin family
MTLRRIGLFFILLFLVLGIGISSEAEEVISKITLLGNVKVEEAAIRSAIKSREGGPFSTDRVREDLRSIFSLGFFTDVQVDIKSTPQGKEVIFIVVEKPSIKQIVITGNNKIKLDDIKDKVSIGARTIFSAEKMKESAEQIRKLYFSKGYYGVKVEAKVDSLETNEVNVAFIITEGTKGHIKRIVFKGNKKISSSELRKAMQTKRWTIFSLISKTGNLDEDMLKNDVQLLTAYYIDHGYHEVDISEPKIDLRDPKRIQIEINISEGPQYHFGEIDFRGDFLTTKEDLFKLIKIKRNKPYSNTDLRKDISTLTEKYADQGYAYVEVNPETAIDSKKLAVGITFDITKKKRVYYEKIRITGNTKTRDKVIRRELRIAEGELYNATAMNKSKNRLQRTGYFRESEFSTSRGSSDDRMNLDLKVQETPTGAFSVGIGYSTLESVVGSASIQDRNLFGLGYNAGIRFSLGATSENIRFSFTDPYFLGYNFGAGFDLYHERIEYFSTYNYKLTGGDIRVGKQVTDTFRLDSMYKLEKITVYNVTDNASTIIKDQIGTKVTSAISLSPILDTRNDYYNPTSGSRHTFLIQDAGGVLGGDNYFVKVLATTSWYFPMPLNTVLNLRGQAGAIMPYEDKKLPIYEKFFVGGIRTLRGFEFGKAGPKDINNEPVGASKIIVFNSELVFPIARDIGLRGAVFWDIGKGFDKFSQLAPLKTGVGAGIRWYSPFGPIQIDLGFNPIPKKGEKGHVVDFTAGSTF